MHRKSSTSTVCCCFVTTGSLPPFLIVEVQLLLLKTSAEAQGDLPFLFHYLNCTNRLLVWREEFRGTEGVQDQGHLQGTVILGPSAVCSTGSLSVFNLGFSADSCRAVLSQWREIRPPRELLIPSVAISSQVRWFTFWGSSFLCVGYRGSPGWLAQTQRPQIF